MDDYHGSVVPGMCPFKSCLPDYQRPSFDCRNSVTLPGMSTMCRTRPRHRSLSEGIPASHVVSSIFTKGKECTSLEARTITASSHCLSCSLKKANPNVVRGPWQGTRRWGNRSSVLLNETSKIKRSLTHANVRISGWRRWTSISLTLSNGYL